jgi:hypothetical protein
MSITSQYGAKMILEQHTLQIFVVHPKAQNCRRLLGDLGLEVDWAERP